MPLGGGCFILKELTQQEALDRSDMTLPSLQEIVKLAIDSSDQAGEFLSDHKIKELIEKQGVNITPRYVTKIRRKLGIPSSGERKKTSKAPKK
jgi:DNA-directed RNA polymerase specialized sigma54-like protein